MALAALEAVVHVAGLTKARREAEFFAVNRDGSARLAEAVAAAAAPGARCVLVSSMAAREPRLSPYAASKRGAELEKVGNSGNFAPDDPAAIARAPPDPASPAAGTDPSREIGAARGWTRRRHGPRCGAVKLWQDFSRAGSGPGAWGGFRTLVQL